MSEREIVPFTVEIHLVKEGFFIYRIVNLSSRYLSIMIKVKAGLYTDETLREEINLNPFEHRFYSLRSPDARFYVIKNE